MESKFIYKQFLKDCLLISVKDSNKALQYLFETDKAN